MTNKNDKRKKNIMVILLIILTSMLIATISISTSTHIKNANNYKKEDIENKNSLKALETKIEDKNKKIEDLKVKLKDSDITKEQNSNLKSQINNLNSEVSNLNNKIMILEPSIEEKNNEIQDLKTKLVDANYGKREDVDVKNFSNNNFGMTLSTIYKSQINTDPLEEINDKNFSSRLTLKKNTSSSNINKKELLLEFNEGYIKNFLNNDSYKMYIKEENNKTYLKWSALLIMVIVEHNLINNNLNRIFPFSLENSILKISYLDKNLKVHSKEITINTRNNNNDENSNEIIDFDFIYSNKEYYRFVVEIKPFINTVENYSDYSIYAEWNNPKQYKYTINNDWNISNYNDDKDVSLTDDVKLYWKDYQPKNSENDMPAYLDVILHLSRKKQLEIIENIKKNIPIEKQIKDILFAELSKKDFYQKIDNSNKKLLISWKYILDDDNQYNISSIITDDNTTNSQPFEYDKYSFFVNVFRINFADK
ncbi:coiled-coil domain-containing protein [Mycoplasma zalophi]|uniref:coiled-coil domain-containing protein n=1 Tax=Mycoplasma zalophi TaxID=191287 RepID=UPI001C12567A|nr:hypothetical protein [Mycoplasma zalophi]MBU4690808.1 hypothetical protein [Mycoplasma zalophi]